jgi:hypothetical protein
VVTASTRCSLLSSPKTGETLAGVPNGQRRGQHRADHVTVRDRAIAQLPEEIARGHRVGDDPKIRRREVVVRADSAGSTEGLLSACRSRNVTFFVTARQHLQVMPAVSDAVGLESVWGPALGRDWDLREALGVRAHLAHRCPQAAFGHPASSGASRFAPVLNGASSGA